MRKALYELRLKRDKMPKDYLRVLNSLARECDKMDFLYDHETAHGVYKSEQDIWNKKIAYQLYNLRKYASDNY